MTRQTQHDSSMSPGFLVASPKLDGSPFERAVILLVHHDPRGAMGYIINKPVDVDFGTLIASVNTAIQPKILADRFEKTVYFGGPVRIEQLWVLYKHELGEEPEALQGGAAPSPPEPAAHTVSESMQNMFSGALPAAQELLDPGELAISDRWALSASGRVIEDFAMGQADDYFMPVLGYAGWGAGQLEAEIGEGSWLLADFDDSLIFDGSPFDCWTRALDEIGIDPTTFLMMGKVGSA
jgi:putative transcriptional regulator